ncbi:MAG: zf-HC2 domain-containing protein [Ruminococcus sp.]|jgi:hypothetical protein|nr:zf-HC2 domain-containing protein [Ruminococcus sp.]
MLSHNVVKDLLPAYIDGLCSSDTNAEIAEHLDDCYECKKVYKAMKEPEPTENLPVTKDLDYLKKIRKRNLRRVLIASLSVLACAVAFVFVFVIGVPADSEKIVYRFEHKGTGENYNRIIDGGEGLNANIFELDFYMIDEGNLALHQKIHDEKTADGVDRTVTITVNTVPELLGMGRFYHYPLKSVDDPNDRNIKNCKVIVKFADKTLVYIRESNHITGMSDTEGNWFDCDYYSYSYELQQ